MGPTAEQGKGGESSGIVGACGHIETTSAKLNNQLYLASDSEDMDELLLLNFYKLNSEVILIMINTTASNENWD